jgi:hypothetical protein
MNCHMHQPNIFLNSFLGYTMWDYESDAPSMWPKEQKYPTAEEVRAINDRNPEAAAARGLWGDVNFLEKSAELNPQLKETQFADYHGHGWMFRAVFKKDREGNTVVTKLDEVTLQKMAASGGGTYVRATTSRTGLTQLMDELEGAKREEFGSKMFTSYEDRFQYFLGIAIFLLILEFLMPSRKRRLFTEISLFKKNG